MNAIRRAAFLEAQLEGVTELAFVNVLAAVIAPNLALFGRTMPGAVAALEGTA
ncbi:MAG TPA: hypothetical protein PLS53_13230 [Thermoanaerobaculaceae bacterium]|nr:hypothetical protein [Thermoanaerobaculaceae bacterium]HPS79114.1 hypothetical protein [Thermoanaerobaculaceae bacterium]